MLDVTLVAYEYNNSRSRDMIHGMIRPSAKNRVIFRADYFTNTLTCVNQVDDIHR